MAQNGGIKLVAFNAVSRAGSGSALIKDQVAASSTYELPRWTRTATELNSKRDVPK